MLLLQLLFKCKCPSWSFSFCSFFHFHCSCFAVAFKHQSNMKSTNWLLFSCLSLIFFESTKIKRTTLSTTVAELYALMKCYGTCQMLRGLIKDITSHSCEIHMRTDANNLVTTASTTHVPEQQETIHMIQMLRKEACSGAIADLSHIRTQWCLADCLTKKSANPQALIDAVRQGMLKEVDAHPPFRTLVEHKAYLRSWLPTVCHHVNFALDVFFLAERFH